MKLSRKGYVNNIKRDKKGTVGIKEEYNSSKYMGKHIITASFGVDNRGVILIPAYESRVEGFLSLADYENDMETFYKSNKSTFSNLESLLLFTETKATFNLETHELEDIDVNLYIVKAIDKDEDKIYFNAVTYKEGVLDTIKIPEKLYTGYINNIKNFFNYLDCADKIKYLEKRCRISN